MKCEDVVICIFTNYTIKKGALPYTLIGVVEEVLFQHQCLASILSSKIPVTHIVDKELVYHPILHYVSMHPTKFFLEKMGAKQGC